MSSDSPTQIDRRVSIDRRTTPERRNDGERRDLLIGLGGKIVAAPQSRDPAHANLPGFPKSARGGPSLEFIHPEGQFKIGSQVPISPAVRAGNLVYVSGVPAYDVEGQLAVGDFTAQMAQVMLNITGILKAAGTDWGHVIKANVLLTRASDVAEMNRIYAAHFAEGKYPARTTSIVAALPNPDFLLEIECVALAA